VGIEDDIDSHAVLVGTGIGTCCSGYREGNKGYHEASGRAESAMGAKRRDFEFITGRPPLPKKGKSGPSSGQFQRRGGVSPQEGAQEDLDKSVEEELGEDSLDRELKLLEGLQSKRDQYIRFVRGVSSDTREIALRCRGDVIFVEVRGIDGKSARM